MGTGRRAKLTLGRSAIKQQRGTWGAWKMSEQARCQPSETLSGIDLPRRCRKGSLFLWVTTGDKPFSGGFCACKCQSCIFSLGCGLLQFHLLGSRSCPSSNEEELSAEAGMLLGHWAVLPLELGPKRHSEAALLTAASFRWDQNSTVHPGAPGLSPEQGWARTASWSGDVTPIQKNTPHFLNCF